MSNQDANRIARNAGDSPERRSYARGEEDSSERAGHGWPAPDLQAERDARAQQGIGSVQGGIHSASSAV